jgi:(p)ppGpp synthase/HD superfamily hydrolase
MDERILYIIKAHIAVNHKYDGLPYTVHLNNVVRVAKKYLHLIESEFHDIVIIACWGHDLIEDTHESYNDAKRILGERIADIIFAVSNEKGKVRKDRANEKYYSGIKSDHLALFVKLCDRISNMKYSKLYGNASMFKKYNNELPHFKEQLYNGLYDEMWNDLEKIEFTKKDEMIYKDIVKFDTNTVHCIHLPKPIPGELYNELFQKGVIRKSDLIIGKYYYGKCRNTNVAVWNGSAFVYMRSKFGTSFPENINHLEDDNGFDLFVPIEEVIPVENQKVIY